MQDDTFRSGASARPLMRDPSRSSYGIETPNLAATAYPAEPFDPSSVSAATSSRRGQESSAGTQIHPSPPLSPQDAPARSERDTRSQVYVVHHDGGRAPVTIMTSDGAEVVELPPGYAAVPESSRGRVVAESRSSKSGSVAVAEGAPHRRLRKIIAPAFAPSTIKGLAPIFVRKASELCDHWRAVLSESPVVQAPGVEVNADGAPTLDVYNWLGRAAFDVIGLAAFGYSFNSLRDDTNELFGAYMRLHHVTREGPTLRDNLCLTAPWLERFLQDDNSRAVAASAQVIQSTSKMLLQQRRERNPEGDSKSILGLLLRCNQNAAPEDRLSDEELLAQIDAFLLGGADTSSIATVWALHELSLNPDLQKALRAELAPLNLGGAEHDFLSDSGIECDYAAPDPVAQFTAIDALPILDRIVREVLRVHPPVHSSLRVADADDIVPFSPDTPPRLADGSVSRAIVTGKAADGTVRTGIRVRKGEFVHLPFEAMNTARTIWGEDAHEFKPDRWLNLPSAAKNNVGLVSGLMSFSVGPHSCPASRLAIAEIKTTLAHVVSSFTFEESAKILPHNMMVTRPWVDDEWENGYRLPLRVRAL
ncbi:hypothetical protein FRC07_006341 [Ceratobasidium sp. 392]|nr:hypothetical protein FRC07_006341 [Ceratobasidium sp. 392]